MKNKSDDLIFQSRVCVGATNSESQTRIEPLHFKRRYEQQAKRLRVGISSRAVAKRCSGMEGTMKMEELLPIVGKLAQKYTAGESTSVTYEKAQQLMGAVLYCIHEAKEDNQNALAVREGMPIEEIYETGAANVVEKTKRALKLYNKMLQEFDAYENRCLHDTFVKELPKFFKWYDAKFEPQNTVVTLDYPVLEDLSELEGVDKIEAYINCLNREQKFLSMFSREEVIAILRNYSLEYKDMVENICRIVMEEKDFR